MNTKISTHEDDFFPQGLALDENFCNREQEREHLTANIKSARPTLVSSPRRYGKTSLILYVIKKLKLPYAHIDLYSDFSAQEAQDTLLSGVGNLVYSLQSISKKTLSYLTDFFSEMNVSFKFIGTKIQVELNHGHKTSAKSVLSALEKLDELLLSRNKKVVLFFDEFQRLGQIPEALVFEGALRHVAQQSKNIAFIFSGSNRHLLRRIFDDSTKPFYKLCDRILLERIAAEHYEPFIQLRAKTRWKKKLSREVIETIFRLTERHSYYLNVLCHRAWLQANAPSSSQDVETIWHKYALEEKSHLLAELELLSINQFKMLTAIAKHQGLQPTSQEFIAATKFSLSSAAQALQWLMQKDYVYLDDEKKYRVLDPLIAYVFSQAP